jgi:hypothetical protein
MKGVFEIIRSYNMGYNLDKCSFLVFLIDWIFELEVYYWNLNSFIKNYF